MNLTNANTSANESLAVRASILAELKESINQLSPFAQALLQLDDDSTPELSDTRDTYYMQIWNAIKENNGVTGAVGVNEDGTVKTVLLRTEAALDVFQGNTIVDYYFIKAVYNGQEENIGSQADTYAVNGQTKGAYLHSRYSYSLPTFLNELEIDEFLDGFSQQMGSVDILTSLANMAISGPVSYADIVSVLSSSGSFVDSKLHSIVSQYATYLSPDNACSIINFMITDYFNAAKGYFEENDTLKFNSLKYDYDSSCLLGWHQTVGIFASAVAVVAAIFSPVTALLAGAVGAVVTQVGEFLENNDPSAPRVVPEAAHNIASLPVWQATASLDTQLWAHKFIQRSGRLTITTEFFKIFAWLSDPSTISLEMYVNTCYGYDVVDQWRDAKQGLDLSGSIRFFRSLMNFSTSGDSNNGSRSFRIQDLPNADSNGDWNGSWLLPYYFPDQTIPSESEGTDLLFSRIFNGLFMCSIYVLYASRQGGITVTEQRRNSSLPSDYTDEQKLLWYVGAYLDAYSPSFVESSMADWLVPGWFETLKNFASTVSVSNMLSRFTNSYYVGDGQVSPSIMTQDYGKVSNIRCLLTPTITSKGSAMIIPPSSRYSIGQKLAITAGIAAAISVAAIVASVRFRSIQARNVQNQRIKVNAAYKAYQATPNDTNWKAFAKQVRTYNRWTFFNGAARISTANWGSMSAPLVVQSTASGETALQTLLKTDGVNTAVNSIVQDQLPEIRGNTSDTYDYVDQFLQQDGEFSSAIRSVINLIKGSDN